MIRAAPWLALAAIPILAHAPEWAGLIASNPLYFVSGLGHMARPPLVAGSPGWIDPNAGFNTQALGREAARQWLHGQVPWWDHFAGVGVPLAAEMQCAALFLPFVLLLGAFDGVLYLKISLQIAGGLACLALLRQLGMTRRAALLGAILFQLNGTFAVIGDAPMLPVAFLPVVLLGIERASAAAITAAGGGWAWLGIGGAYAVYAGFPETSLIYLMLAACWALWRLLRAPRCARRAFATKLGAGGAAALLLAAPAILPFLQYLTQATLGTRDAGLPRLAATSAAAFLLPGLLGPPSYDWRSVQWGMAGGFIGLPLAAIASLGVRAGARDGGLRIVLALWCAVALAISAGLIPFPHAIWFARYAVPSWESAAIILAACALDDWHRGARWGPRGLAAVAACWVVAACGAIALAWPALSHVQADHPGFVFFPVVTVGITLILGAACARMLARPCTRARATAMAGVLAGQALLLALFPLLSGARGAAYDRAAVRFLQSHVGLGRFFTLGPVAPNYGSFFAAASINHNLLPVARLWADHVRAWLDPAMDAVSFTGAYPPGVVAGETRLDALVLRLAAYEALGVAYVVEPRGMAPPGKRARLAFADPWLDIYALAHPAPYFEVRGGACTLAPVDRDNTRASCRAPAQLVRRELYFPGWRARSSGRDLTIGEVDGLFQVVALPAGESLVTYAYAPPRVGWAYGSFVLGLLLTAWPMMAPGHPLPSLARLGRARGLLARTPLPRPLPSRYSANPDGAGPSG